MRGWTVLVAAGLICACRNEPSRLEVELLADGEWVVLDQSERGALLMLNHTRVPTVRMLTDRLAGVVTDTFSLHVGDSIIPFLRIAGGVFYMSMPGGPRLQRSPADAQRYAFEHEDGIWLFQAPATVSKLTLDEDLRVLRGKQREGEVILYFAVNPVWSGDGEFISFLSNREAVRADTGGQSIWLIDVGAGVQRPLYDDVGVSAHVDGILGEEFVFSSSASPGLSSVHPRTQAVRRLGSGYAMGSHPRGTALLMNDAGRLVLLSGAASDTMAAPPLGHTWSTRAAFSPSGERIAIFSSTPAGSYNLHILDADGDVVAPYRLPEPPSYGPEWTSESSVIFAAGRRAQQTFRATLR